MKHITTQDALRALEEAVAEKGEDYIYRRTEGACVYVVRDLDDELHTSCIAGNALVRLGLPIAELADLPQGQAVAYLMRSLGVGHDAGARAALATAQRLQDKGETWGDAVSEARQVAREAVKS